MTKGVNETVRCLCVHERGLPMSHPILAGCYCIVNSGLNAINSFRMCDVAITIRSAESQQQIAKCAERRLHKSRNSTSVHTGPL